MSGWIDQQDTTLSVQYGAPVQSVADLRLVAPVKRADKLVIFVEDQQAQYHFDTADTTTPDDGDLVIAPDDPSAPNGRWFKISSGSGGDVVGPAVATADAVPLYSGTTGKLLKDGPVPGAANGLATLDGGVTIPDAQIPAAITRDSELTTHAGLPNVHHTSANDPSTDQKAALAGTGIPAVGNPYVNDDDARLSDARTPTAHAASHQNAGGDEIATATPAANSIPKTGGTADLDTWISDSSETVKGKIEIANNAEVAAGIDDLRAVTPAKLSLIGGRVSPKEHFFGGIMDYPASGALSANDIQYTRIWLSGGLSIDTLRVFQDSGGNAARSVRLGLYDQVTPTDLAGIPNAKVAETALTATAGGGDGAFLDLATLLTLVVPTTGYYWLAVVQTSAALKFAVSDTHRANYLPRREQTGAGGGALPASASGLTNPSSAVVFLSALEV